MQIKRYEAVSTDEAMKKVKADLGPDAVVLSTKRLKRGVEVVAARDSGEKRIVGNHIPKSDPYEMLALFRAEADQLKSLIRDLGKERTVHAELAELKEGVDALLDVIGFGKNENAYPILSKVYHHLVSVGISKKKARALTNDLKESYSPEVLGDYRRALEAVEDIIKESFTLSRENPKKKRVLVFAGPSGEGKTTTLAKVAARSLFEEKRSVGVITTDTYRIGASEQLRIYADIMNIPVEVVSERRDLGEILNRFSDRDVILMDTPGRNRCDDGRIFKSRGCLPSNVPAEVNLVLSVTSSMESAMDAVNSFGDVDYDSIIFTKLDDSRKFGAMYDIVDSTGKPVSYIANGQNVPNDLKKMDPAGLARLIIENRMH
jgi:flagellar biosynthesis protein FlhF